RAGLDLDLAAGGGEGARPPSDAEAGGAAHPHRRGDLSGGRPGARPVHRERAHRRRRAPSRPPLRGHRARPRVAGPPPPAPRPRVGRRARSPGGTLRPPPERAHPIAPLKTPSNRPFALSPHGLGTPIRVRFRDTPPRV